MKVLKFGGTSVGSAESIKQVKDIIRRHVADSAQVVVVSAVGGVTNKLVQVSSLAVEQNEAYKEPFKAIEEQHLELIRKLLPAGEQTKVISKLKQELNNLEILIEGVFLLGEMTDKTYDRILSYGELFSSYIISKYLTFEGIDTVYQDSREVIITDDHYGRANVLFKKTNERCAAALKPLKIGQVALMPGFIAASEKGFVTTLGRGGSDYTAAIVAAAVNADVLEIWTDVSGIFTAIPQLVKQARPIERLSYLEAMELSHFGAKVLYAPTIQPILNENIPLYIKNTFEPNAPGTYIGSDIQKSNGEPVKGISHLDNIALLTLEGSGMVGVAGVAKKMFSVLSEEKINVVLITQASSEHSISICMNRSEAKRAKTALDHAFRAEIADKKINPVVEEEDLCILAAVGDGMRNYQGLGGKMFSALGRNNVNIRAIAQGASERNISVVINKNDSTKALNTLHECFFEEDIKLLNLFITGVGNVGQKFLEQLHRQQAYMRDNFRINLRVVALSNSKKMYFDPQGIDLSDWSRKIDQGEPADKEVFFRKVISLNLRNSVFIDNTASVHIAGIYDKYLSHSISVVTCNKIACSSSFERYKFLKSLTRKYGASMRFETNVGAALPIIDTLQNLVASGDKIKEIHAVLSGSLNFIFNRFNGKNKFHEVVKLAQKEGYTEPDPKIDLSGIDVARKILILIRESGYEMNIEDIENVSFLSKESLETEDIDAFFASLEKHSDHFEALYQKAHENGCKLKYVASFKEGKAKVGLQEIPSNHPFYNLEGKDNIVLFYTNRYNDQPLLIKGAGAGAEVTASGIFADIIRVANF